MSKYFFFIIVLIFFSCQSAKTFTEATEKYGNVLFSKNNVDESTDFNHVNSFILNKDEYLNIHFTLKKPLVESLQEMAPQLTEDELLEKGNFQFSFLVEEEVIYIENLNKGAGLKVSKTEEVNHTIRLIAPEQLDYWGWFMWMKFMKLGGGRDVLSDGTHSLTLEVRAYLKEDSLTVGPILAKGKLNIEVGEILVDESLIPVQKIQPESGWVISKSNFDEHKIEALNRKIAEGRFEGINGIVVIKNEELLIEEYFNGAGRDSLHDPRSVGKSFASTTLGIAIEDGFIENENAELKEFYDLKKFRNYSFTKGSVTLKSLLTMSSGFDGDDNEYSSTGNEENMYPTDNWVTFALDLPMAEGRNIGDKFAYFTAGVVVLGDIIHQSVPGGLVTYADKKLFQPLGITNYKWEYTPQNVGNTAGGIRLRALDFAKYGQLYKNKGVWNRQQVLSKEWVEKSLGKHIEQSLDNGHYGYLFWNKQFSLYGKEYEVSYCSGNGGNKIFIFKELPYVVVITSSLYNHPSAHANSDKIITDYILPALLKSK